MKFTRWDGERSQIIVLVALMAVVLFAISGIALDVGRMYATKARLSRAVDAAALSRD
jgi:Flp pilus assembly protein TadG